MSYSCTVAITCEPLAYEEIIAVAKKQNLIPDKVLKNDRWNEYTLFWNWVKWYTDASDAIMACLKRLDDMRVKSDGYGYACTRMGENYDDAIVHFSNDYYPVGDVNVTLDLRPCGKEISI